MFYLVGAINLLVLGFIVMFCVRYARASAEAKSAMLKPNKRSIWIASSIFGLIAISIISFIVFSIGIVGFRVSSASKQHLASRFGPASSWSIQMGDHIERSEEPRSGSYRIRYRFGDKNGVMLASYTEINGQFNVEFTDEE